MSESVIHHDQKVVQASVGRKVQIPDNGEPPKVDIHLLTPNHLRTRVDLLRRFFGREGIQLARAFRNGADLLDPDLNSLRERADANFFREMQNTPGLTSTNPESFYKSSLNAANETIVYFRDTAAPEKKKAIGGLNEVTVPETRPSSMIYYFSADIDPRLRFETERQIALGYIAGALEERNTKAEVQNVVARIQQVFNKELYTGKPGSAKTVFTYAWHDNKTNSVIELANDATPLKHKSASHLKKHPTRVREIEGIGNVKADFDIKDIESSVIKALLKAQRDLAKGPDGNGGIIDIDTEVQDMIRARMVVQGTDNIDDPRIDALITRVKEVLLQNSGKGKPLPEIEDIIPDDEKREEVARNKPRSKRLQIKFKGIPVPFEMQFYDQKTDLNGEFEVGTMKDDGYDGYAHDIYRLRDLKRIRPFLYPVPVFTNEEENGFVKPNDLIMTSRQKAFSLRNAYRVAPED